MRAVAPPPPSLYPCRRPVPSLACSPRLSSHAPPGPSCRWPRPARLGVAPRGAPISASFPAIFDVRLRVSTNGGGARSRGVARGRHSGGARGAAVKSKARARAPRARGGMPRQTDTFFICDGFHLILSWEMAPKKRRARDHAHAPGPFRRSTSQHAMRDALFYLRDVSHFVSWGKRAPRKRKRGDGARATGRLVDLRSQRRAIGPG